jgi:hypothetical protein
VDQLLKWTDHPIDVYSCPDYIDLIRFVAMNLQVMLDNFEKIHLLRC